MSKPAKSSYTKVSKPFIDDDKITIKANESEGKIISFEVKYKGKHHTFKVVGNKVLEAWKKVEDKTKDLK